ncbi:MAG: protein phosphatase 2C domain-containing protein [Acidobacteriota bacterium]|nr:protein phosphatase 2C domain-containing protein [Acidobacteriota bacterium]
MNDTTKESLTATPATQPTSDASAPSGKAATSATQQADAPTVGIVRDTAQVIAQQSDVSSKERTQSAVGENKQSATAQPATSAEWRVVGETVPGASHLRAGIPNQDALLQMRASSIGLPIILTVSDGHGSNKCFRSDRGSRFAVHLAATLMSETFNLSADISDTKSFAEKARVHLPGELVRRWRAAVEADLRREPLREAEFAKLIEKDGARARQLVEANPHLAYGATLLIAAVTSSFALYMQLGDGEILHVSASGEVTQPLPEDARLLANETTSLCLNKAAEDFRFALHTFTDTTPALILLTTDGYANSFSTTAGFHQVGGDLIDMMRADGFDSVNRGVKGWLEEATTTGSGDDCTLALLVRMDALAAVPATEKVTEATVSTATGLTGVS